MTAIVIMDIVNETDLLISIQLQAEFDEEYKSSQSNKISIISSTRKKDQFQDSKLLKSGSSSSVESVQEKFSVSLIDPSWELIDPNPNIHDLFLTFNQQFFWGSLLGIEVKWSPRMTLCAGVCSYEGRGGLCSIRLSTPLLKLRPRKDLVETLLHEMIHAYLFVTQNDRDRDGHGPNFHEHMFRINRVAGTKISVYHTFHDEVDSYRQHIWRCNGPCQRKAPYFGLVKRSMNRAPSPRDPWWPRHQMSCGGTYLKISEPDKPSKDKKKIKSGPSKDIRSFFTTNSDNSTSSSNKKLNVFDFQNDSSFGDRAMSSNEILFKGPTKSNDSKHPALPDKSKNKSTFSNFGTSTQVITKNRNKDSTKENVPELKIKSDTFKGAGHSLKGQLDLTEDQRKQRFLRKFENSKIKNFNRGKEKKTTGANSTSASFQKGKMPYNIKENSSNADVDPLRNKAEKSCYDSCQGQSPFLDCPLCKQSIKSNSFEHHLSNCFGVLDIFVSDDCMESASESDFISNTRSKINSAQLEVENDCLIIEDKNLSTPNHSSSENKPLSFYECPVCSLKFSEKEINQHTESHFLN